MEFKQSEADNNTKSKKNDGQDSTKSNSNQEPNVYKAGQEGTGTSLDVKSEAIATDSHDFQRSTTSFDNGFSDAQILALFKTLNEAGSDVGKILSNIASGLNLPSTHVESSHVEVSTNQKIIGLLPPTKHDSSSNITYNVNIPSIQHTSDVKIDPIVGIPTNVTVTPQGSVLSEAIQLESKKVVIDKIESSIDSSVVTVRISNDTYIDIPPIQEDFDRFLNFQYDVIDTNYALNQYLGMSDLERYLLLSADPFLNMPIKRITLEISEGFKKRCIGFNANGYWECGMPFSTERVINQRTMVDMSNIIGIHDASKNSSKGIIEAMDFISGMVMFSLDAARQFHTILISKKSISPASTSLRVNAPVEVMNEPTFPKICYTHPVLSGLSEAIKGSTRMSIDSGVDEYGKMKVGKVSTIAHNHNNLSLIVTYWNFTDVLTSRMLSDYFSRAYQPTQDGNLVLEGLRASSFTSATFKLLTTPSQHFAFGKPLVRDQECSNLLYALAADSTMVERLLSTYASIFGSMGLITDQSGKPTALRAFYNDLFNRDVYLNRLFTNFGRATKTSISQLIAFMVMPELMYINFDIPKPETIVDGIFTFYAICLSIIFFPSVTVYAIPKIHSFMLDMTSLVTERSALSSQVLIYTRDKRPYGKRTEENLNLWLSEGLMSAFFNPDLSDFGGPTTKILVSILQSSVRVNLDMNDLKAQDAQFPRLYSISGEGRTNGGKMRPWEFRAYEDSQSTLYDSIVLLTERLSLVVGRSVKSRDTSLKLSAGVVNNTIHALSAMAADAEITAMALTGKIARIVTAFPNLSTSILYRNHKSYFQPIYPPLVLYDTQNTSRYVTIGANGYEGAPVYSIYSAIALTQNFLLFDEVQGSLKNEAAQPFSMIAPSPMLVYAACSDIFADARGAGKILSFTNYLHDSMLDDNGKVRRLIDLFGYEPPAMNASKYSNLFEYCSKVLGVGMTWFKKDDNERNNLTKSVIVKIIKPYIGELRSSVPCKLNVPGHPVIDNIFRVTDTDLIGNFETIFDLMLDRNWVVNRLERGLFLTKNHIVLETYKYYKVRELNAIPFSDTYFKRIAVGQYMTMCFVYQNVTYNDPNSFPKLTFEIKPGTSFDSTSLALLTQGYQHGRFSFYLSSINYIWEFGKDIETEATFVQLLTYTTYKIFKIMIPDRDGTPYYTNNTLIAQAGRSLFPVNDIFRNVIGTGFNLEGQMTGARQLDTSIMESGFPLGPYGTGVKDINDSLVPKPYHSKSMNNILPYVTSNARIDDETYIECTIDNWFHE